MARPTDWHNLDLPGDPTPRDSHEIKTQAHRFQIFASEVAAAHTKLNAAAEDSVLTESRGKAMEGFRDAVGKLPSQLVKGFRKIGFAFVKGEGKDTLKDFMNGGWSSVEKNAASDVIGNLIGSAAGPVIDKGFSKVPGLLYRGSVTEMSRATRKAYGVPAAPVQPWHGQPDALSRMRGVRDPDAYPLVGVDRSGQGPARGRPRESACCRSSGPAASRTGPCRPGRR